MKNHRLLVLMTDPAVSVLLGKHAQGTFPHTRVDHRICSQAFSLGTALSWSLEDIMVYGRHTEYWLASILVG